MHIPRSPSRKQRRESTVRQAFAPRSRRGSSTSTRAESASRIRSSPRARTRRPIGRGGPRFTLGSPSSSTTPKREHGNWPRRSGRRTRRWPTRSRRPQSMHGAGAPAVRRSHARPGERADSRRSRRRRRPAGGGRRISALRVRGLAPRRSAAPRRDRPAGTGSGAGTSDASSSRASASTRRRTRRPTCSPRSWTRPADDRLTLAVAHEGAAACCLWMFERFEDVLRHCRARRWRSRWRWATRRSPRTSS